MATRDFLFRLGAGIAAFHLLTSAAAVETVADCRQEADDIRRLACYDRLFRDPLAATPAGESSEKVAAGPEPTPLGRFWELDAADKRGTFIVRTYQPNFLLPIHYTSSLNRLPSSPTHPGQTLQAHYRPLEAKLQISLRAKIAEDLLLPNADLWFAYTQRSLWQLWNRQESAPFRSTDYQPEATYVVPVPQRLGALPGGWSLRMVRLGLAHQSNGQTDPLSRSWNSFYGGVALEKGEIVLQARTYYRLQEAGGNDNPGLTHYIGDTEFVGSWLPGLSTASVTWRTDRHSLSRGSLQLDWTYPVSRDQPTGLRWYVQLFTGYGETLLDYNHRQTSLGLGLTLFQF